MNGISVINAPTGEPMVLTVDLRTIDPAVSPLVNALLALMEQQRNQPADYEFAATVEEERAEWQSLAYAALNRAYGDNEPDYSDVPAYTTRTRSE
jgi:hypothetical protein